MWIFGSDRVFSEEELRPSRSPGAAAGGLEEEEEEEVCLSIAMSQLAAGVSCAYRGAISS